MSKNYFGHLDSRNTKYQGLIKNDTFYGTGMLMDQSYTFALSNWKGSELNGPSIIIFPNMQIFFGQVQNNKLTGIQCFQLSRNEKLVFSVHNENDRSKTQRTTLAYVFAQQSVVELETNSQTNQFKVREVFYTKTQQDQGSILSKIFGKQLQKDKLDLTCFIKKNFVQATNLFQLSGKNQLFFGFKDTSSLGFKLQNNSPTSVGYFYHFPRNLIFGRKINYNLALPANTSIEEGFFQTPSKTFTCMKQKGASIESQKFCEEYFKKSTTFRNQFTQLDHLKNIHNYLKKIAQQVKVQTAKRFGQALLENDYGSAKHHEKEVVTKEYTLQEIKEEIYQAVNKKQCGYTKTLKSPVQQLTKQFVLSQTSNFINSQRKAINSIGLRNNNLKQSDFHYGHSKKQDLVNNVNQILKTTKQSEKAIIKQLIHDCYTQHGILRSQQQLINSSNFYESFSGTRKYHKYEPKISPFVEQFNPVISSSRYQVKNNKRPYRDINFKGKLNHSYLIEKNIDQNDKKQKERYEKNKLILNEEQIDDNPHKKLCEYKERRRSVTPQYPKQKNKENRQEYLKENHETLQLHAESNRNKTMNQIKLFGNKTCPIKEKQLSVFTNRNQTEGNHLNENPKKSNKYKYFQSQINRNEEAYLPQKTNQIFTERATFKNCQQQNRQNKYNDNTDYQREKSLINSYGARLAKDEGSKKLKRTFHYID